LFVDASKHEFERETQQEVQADGMAVQCLRFAVFSVLISRFASRAPANPDFTTRDPPVLLNSYLPDLRPHPTSTDAAPRPTAHIFVLDRRGSSVVCQAVLFRSQEFHFSIIPNHLSSIPVKIFCSSKRPSALKKSLCS
jgi:hypothetical protein